MKIGRLSVNNPVPVNILMVVLLLLGGLSLYRMPREQFSEFTFYIVNIRVPWPGISAEDVEKALTIPIEDEMQGLEDLNQIRSVSREGLSIVTVAFDNGITPERFDKLFQDLSTRFSQVELPEDVLKPSIESFSSNDFTPVIEIVLSGDVGYEELVNTAENLAKPLRRIKDVSHVELAGVRDKRIVVSANRSALESRGISLERLASAVTLSNLNVPGGFLGTDSQDYLVRTSGELEDVKAFGNIILEDGVRLGDVAVVDNAYDERGAYFRFNGLPAVSLIITKVPGGGSVNIIEKSKSYLESRKSVVPEGISVDFMNDASVPINSSLSVLKNNALFGLILLIIILWAFLGLRNALMAALGIPLTFAVTFICLEALGLTLNTNTLFGMVLVLGLIVDHAIVITENSFRMQQSGLGRHKAAVLGTDEVAVPIIAATATTVAAFLPLMILPGSIGQFLRVIPLTVSVALAASLMEALVFLPSHYAEWPGKTADPESGRRFAAFRDWYIRVFQVLYRRRKLTVIVVLVFMVLTFAVVPFLKQDLFSAEDFSKFSIDINMPPGTSTERTDAYVARYEERLLPLVGNGEVAAVASSIGFRTGEGAVQDSSVARIVVDLEERSDGRERSVDEVLNQVRKLVADIPGADRVVFQKAQNGPPTDAPVSFRLFGDSYDSLMIVSDRIRSELSEETTLFNIQDNYASGTPEFVIRVNEERAAYYGLSVSAVGRYIRDRVSGIQATRYFRDNQYLDVLVRFSDTGDLTPALFQQLYIPAPGGNQIPFSAVASVESSTSPASIKRLDGRREITITADSFNKDNIKDINKRIRAIYEQEFFSRFPDMEFVVGGEFAELNDLLIRILRLFLVGIFLVYLILGTQFRSYLQPFLILFSVPLAFSGVVVFLGISGTSFSITVLYSTVALAGIAVNDAIVLISFINEKRKEGLAVADAVEAAVRTRLRPIILTSLTTIAGLAPTAMGLGGRSVVWGPMAGTIIFGLLFSTLATLIFIPALYGGLFDRQVKTDTVEG